MRSVGWIMSIVAILALVAAIAFLIGNDEVILVIVKIEGVLTAIAVVISHITSNDNGNKNQ